jgi:hypothetical protein
MDLAAIFYPVLIVCTMFGVILASGIGFTYLWLLAIDAKARTCPQCRKRGGGEVVESNDLEVRTYTQVTRKPAIGGGGRPQLVRVTDTTYEDHYRCRRCGHRWVKTGEESVQEPVK